MKHNLLALIVVLMFSSRPGKSGWSDRTFFLIRNFQKKVFWPIVHIETSSMTSWFAKPGHTRAMIDSSVDPRLLSSCATMKVIFEKTEAY